MGRNRTPKTAQRRKTMNEETQQEQKQQNEKLLRIETGYDQHASLFR